uniref:ATP synthase subunit a n=1 Tax=Gari togata TaxID=2774046 RepID=A0A8K1YA21_9BIVA|nr:ATP synthase F0 subunit 6 [Gari togata]
MLADVFSSFDYGGSFGAVGFLSWGVLVFGGYEAFGAWGSIWVSKSYGSLVGAKVVGAVAQLVKSTGKSSAFYGAPLFLSGVLVYLFSLSLSGIFPYGFNVLAHFSHNFCLSWSLWFASVLLGVVVDFKGYAGHMVAGGLAWWQAVPVFVFEVVSVLSRLVTLGGRLTMNIIAGKLLTGIGSAFFGALFVGGSVFSPTFFCLGLGLFIISAWECVVGLVQSCIFVFLVCSYMGEGLST